MGIARNLSLLVVGVSAGIVGPAVLSAKEVDFSAVSQGLDSVTQMFADMFDAHQQLQQDYPGNADLPQPLEAWINEFTQNPLQQHQTVPEQLSQLALTLEQQASSHELPAEKRQVMQDYVDLIHKVTGELSQAVAGAGYNSVNGDLQGFTRLHDRDQSTIESKGLELAQSFKALDFEGVINSLKAYRNDFQIAY